MPHVAVIGAGTMGSGIAQVAAQAGWNVALADVGPQVVTRAIDAIRGRLDRLVEKGRLTPDQAAAALARIQPAAAETLAPCELVIEAVVEDLDLKARVLRPLLAAVRPDAIFASNTSSLSISALGQAIDAAGRTVGMHFFNPVPLMPLVEVIAGRDSAPAASQRVAEVARAWGKTPVFVKDTPGFIVNRVARGYYLESLRMLGEGVAGVDEIDAVMRTLGRFRMGPFELMDLIGIDVNYAVSCSVWEQFGRPARLAPHPLQKQRVEAGRIGRKAGEGMYSYAVPHPLPAVVVPRQSFDCPPRLYEAVRRFCDAAADEHGSVTEQYIFARVLVTIINEAGLALDERIASPEDIDTAMKLGTNYPLGPCEWAEKIGRHTCAALLRELNRSVRDGRFSPADWLA